MGEAGADPNAALDQAAGGVAGEESDTTASTSHRAQATTTVSGAARTFCRVRATVGLSGEASVGARDGPPTPPRSPSPELLPEAELTPPPELKSANFSDAEALAQLIGPPVSDSLLELELAVLVARAVAAGVVCRRRSVRRVVCAGCECRAWRGV